jgi:hypothetical protein
MAETLTGNLQVSLSSRLANTAGVAATSAAIQDVTLKQFTTGTAANQANAQYSASGTIAASATPVDIVLTMLTDPFGAVLAFTKVRALIIRNTHATATITVGGAPSANFPLFTDPSDSLPIAPGGIFVYSDFAAGKTVTGIASVLRLASSANGGTYELIVIGTK